MFLGEKEPEEIASNSFSKDQDWISEIIGRYKSNTTMEQPTRWCRLSCNILLLQGTSGYILRQAGNYVQLYSQNHYTPSEIQPKSGVRRRGSLSLC